MNTTIKYVIAFALAIICNTNYAQSNVESNRAKETTKMYYYTFTGILNVDNMEILRNEVLKMQFVTEAKIEYKADKSAGQIKLKVTEYYTNNETEYEFNIYNLKMLLIKNNLMPDDYRFEPVSK